MSSEPFFPHLTIQRYPNAHITVTSVRVETQLKFSAQKLRKPTTLVWKGPTVFATVARGACGNLAPSTHDRAAAVPQEALPHGLESDSLSLVDVEPPGQPQNYH